MKCNQANSKHIVIIAEAGVNHNGSFQRALEMVDAAKKAGADYIKFQTFKACDLVTAQARKADYQTTNTGSGGSQYEMLRALELSDDDFRTIAAYCHEQGIGFLSTPFSIPAANFLNTLGMDFWKIPSGDITNLPLLRHIARLGGKIILSTGMSTMADVHNAVVALTSGGARLGDITLLHCTTQYPAPLGSVNLRAMLSLQTFGCGAVGYSDHTPGIEVPVAAAAIGAMVIEKHFTLSHSLPGPDHKASLEPDELEAMVRAIRNVETALGCGRKEVMAAEQANIPAARKSIVAACAIKKGEPFTEENLAVKRPGTGLSPMLWDKVIGSIAKTDFAPDQLISI